MLLGWGVAWGRGAQTLERRKTKSERRRDAWAFGAQRCCAPTRRIGLTGLLGADEVAAAILLPAGFVALVAEGLFFAEADGADAIGGEAEGDEILLDGAGAAIAEREVVFGGTALVAMAFDGDAELRVIAQEVSGLGESCAGVGANVRLVEIKIGVLDFLGEKRIHVCRGRGFYRGRGGADRDARGAVRAAAGTAGRDGVGCGIGRRDFCGAFGGDGAYLRRDSKLRRVGGGPAQRGRVALANGSGIGGKRDGRLSWRRCWRGRGRRGCWNRLLLTATGENGGNQTCHQQSAVQRTRDHNHSYPPQTYFKFFPSSTHRGEYRNTGGLVPGGISYHDIFYIQLAKPLAKVRPKC